MVLQSVATGIVPVSITEFSVPPGTLYYGQALQYGAEVTSNPPFPGPFYWYNGTQTIATLPSLDNATTSGAFENGIGFSWNQTGTIAAGTYSTVHAVFPGAVMGNTTWSAADSRTTPLPDETFTVQPAPTMLTVSYTPFTLQNFTESILVNVTNTASSNALPEGPVYEVITADSDNSLVGNFSCKLTTLNANTVQAKLLSSFNAEQELTTGSYTAVYTYYPTSNFTQPDSLTLTFEITNLTPPPPPPLPPPPPPGGPAPAPPPPPPLAGNGSTTLVLEVYFSQVKDWLKMCQSRTLYFWATVSATTITTARPTQGPSDGNITFADAAGAIISQGPVQGVSVGHVGRAVSFEAQGGTYGLGTGTHTVMAYYAGSNDGVWLPSAASATYTIPTDCTQQSPPPSFQSNLGVAQEYAQGVVRSLVGGAPGTSIYGYGNNNGNEFGYPDGVAGYIPQPSLEANDNAGNVNSGVAVWGQNAAGQAGSMPMGSASGTSEQSG
ncbi:hypothetical protein CVIRNUC_001008 [Coccomyxa viridis]|uniref:Extracellular protein n=1 Tax=Coccomyxa viridis TaxID=1274662 RepID=A0AAV1HRY0_9CHLO|nr:hypothetical protein CVIRNUC_001008 [Coccomyxa viridis]